MNENIEKNKEENKEQNIGKTIEDNSSNKDDKKNNKSKKNVLVIIGCCLLILVSCGVAVYTAYKLSFKENKTEEVTDVIDTSILFDETNLPKIDASLATQPLTDAFVKNFTGKTTEELNIEYSNTHPAYVSLINKEKDLIVVTEPSEEELQLAKNAGIELEVTKVVNEGFAFFVNKDNPVNSLTLEQIRAIYSGKITNWKELGGNDKEIVAYQRPVNSGSQTGLINLVMNGQEIKIPTVKESVELSMRGIIDYVADYKNGIDSIGYGFYYFVDTMYKNDNIKYIKVDGVLPEYKTIQNETYPILSAYYIVTRKNETNENITKLKEAMLSSRGQKVATEAGYVPTK